MIFSSSWQSDDSRGGGAVDLPEEMVWWLSDRLKDVKLVREGDLQLSNQASFTNIAENMLIDTSAPKGLHKTMVFHHASLPVCKFIWFNETGTTNLDRLGGKLFQSSMHDGPISSRT